MSTLPGKVVLYTAFYWVGLSGIFSTACSRETAEAPGKVAQVTETSPSDDSLYHLDFKEPSIRQAVDAGNAGHEDYKFVQVEVTEVTNPQKQQLAFEVRYLSKSKVSSFLGSFSLYPPDNPGKFIVPTQDKLKEEGVVILTLVTPDKIEGRDPVKVAVRKLKFLKG